MYTQMNLSQPTASVASVIEGLRCARYLKQAINVAEEGFGRTIDTHNISLAVVIVRSFIELHRILNSLMTLPIPSYLEPAPVQRVHDR